MEILPYYGVIDNYKLVTNVILGREKNKEANFGILNSMEKLVYKSDIWLRIYKRISPKLLKLKLD